MVALVLCLLAGCGVDGPPVPPDGPHRSAVETGVSVSGSARTGVAGGF